MKIYPPHFAFVAATMVAGLAAPTQATVINSHGPDPLGLHTQIHDVNLPSENVAYTISGATGTLTVSTPIAQTGALDFVPGSIALGTVNLSVNFHQSGATYLATDAIMDVSGKIGANQHTFFHSTTLQAFGFTENSSQPQLLELLFGTGTGDYGSTLMGMIIHVPLNDAGNNPVVPNDDFAIPFSNSHIQSTTFADTFTVPEPASLALLGLALPWMLLRQRRKPA